MRRRPGGGVGGIRLATASTGCSVSTGTRAAATARAASSALGSGASTTTVSTGRDLVTCAAIRFSSPRSFAKAISRIGAGIEYTLPDSVVRASR